MRVEECNGHKILFYNSPENMPMRRYQRFNKFVMISSDVGSDFTDFDKRSRKGIEYLKKGLIDSAIKEFDNRRQLVFNGFMEYNPKDRALALLVHSIDGEEYRDFTSDGLDKILDKLNDIGYSNEDAGKTVSEVKKKSKRKLSYIFQVSSGTRNFWSTIRSSLRSYVLRLKLYWESKKRDYQLR